MMKQSPITVATAARILSVSEGTVRSMEKRGELSAIRTESNVRLFDRTDVERLAAARQRDLKCVG